MTNPTFPWPMDHNLNNFNGWLSEDYANEVIPYLLHRLKLAEGERDRLVMKVQAAFYEGSSGVWKDDFENWQLNYDIDTMD